MGNYNTVAAKSRKSVKLFPVVVDRRGLCKTWPWAVKQLIGSGISTVPGSVGTPGSPTVVTIDTNIYLDGTTRLELRGYIQMYTQGTGIVCQFKRGSTVLATFNVDRGGGETQQGWSFTVWDLPPLGYHTYTANLWEPTANSSDIITFHCFNHVG